MKSQEIRALIEVKKTEIKGFLNDRKATEAEAAMNEKRSLEKLLETALSLEDEEKRDLEAQRDKIKEDEDVSEFRSIVKQVMGKDMTQEERASVKSSDNSAVLPKEFINQLIVIEKGFGSLEEYVDVIPVTKNEGTIPISEVNEEELPDVPEGDDITDATITTKDAAYKCFKCGEIYSLTSELVDDAEIEIEGIAKRNFTAKTVRTKNTKIVKIIKDNAVTFPNAASYEDINTAIDTAPPAVRAGLVTFTNPKGFSYLKNLKDKEGRPLNLVTEIKGKFYFNNKELVLVDDAILKTEAGKSVTFYVCNSKELVKLFKRKEFTIARSTEAGFKDDTVKIRILGRFDVKKGYARNCYAISF